MAWCLYSCAITNAPTINKNQNVVDKSLISLLFKIILHVLHILGQLI